MNPFIQQIVNQKVNTITSQELKKYAAHYNINLNDEDANKILSILREEKKIDIYNSSQHQKVIKKISQRIGPTLAKKTNDLLQQFSNML